MRALSWWFLAALAVAAGCDGAGDDDSSADDDGESSCPWDDNEGPDTAQTLDLGASVEGYICPLGDQDWYAVEIPAGSDLLTVQLELDAPLSPLGVTYTVYGNGGVDAVASPSSSEQASAGIPIAVTHGLEPGSYHVMVRDVANDAEDTRHAYLLSVSGATDPDPNERNDDAEHATPLTGANVQAYISYRGDEDWYRVDAAASDIIEVRLTMPAAGIEPAFSIIDESDAVLVTESNPAGNSEATELTYLQAAETAGAYYVVVADDDGMDYDASEPYVLEVSTRSDPDANEPNDHPAEATSLGSESCGGAWTSWTSETGYLASSGDIDWYGLDLSGCADSIIDVEVEFDVDGSFPDDLQASLRLVREASNTPCQQDQDCTTIEIACDEDLDCAGYGSACAGSTCSGAGVCLATGTCGATLVSINAGDDDPGRLDLAAPLFGVDRIYLAVNDYHGDALSLDHAYTLRTRVRRDPDPYEPSEAYTAGPPQEDHGTSHHRAAAASIPVHDCTVGDCCDGSTWVEGMLSYTYDQDWYAYEHPCPGEDCMLEFHYDLDGGPAEFYIQVYADGSAWFDNLAEVADSGTQPPASGSFGGVDPSDYCFYAYQGHTGSPYTYYVPIRDTIFVSTGHEEDGTWDFSADQAYRFCIEKVADGCVEPPCYNWEDGCGQP